MTEMTREVQAVLSPYLDDGDSAALERACAMARDNPVDVDALLVWIQDYGAAANLSALAERRLRFAIGLPVVAGPVCRTPSTR